MRKLVLASGSPGRKQLLEFTKYPFIVDVSDYEEDMTLPLPPQELAIHLSQGKAREVASRHSDAVVLAADSFAVFEDQLLGKPHSHKRAVEMLKLLSGKKHQFITGFTVIDTNSGKETSGSAVTDVYFRKLSNQEIANYLKKENVLLKAGAYSIQDLGGMLVRRIDGDYTNVQGLPLVNIAQALHQFGVKLI